MHIAFVICGHFDAAKVHLSGPDPKGRNGL